MVIAATSDIHGFIDNLKEDVEAIKPDVFVIAGDLHPCYIGEDPDVWFAKKFFPLVRQLSIPVVAIPGNHDFWLNKHLCACQSKTISIPRNFHLLCDSSVTIKGVRFYGTPWVPWINGNWCWEASDKTLMFQFSRIPRGVDVLITHTPPKVNHQFLDISLRKPQQYWRHFGSPELTEAIRAKKPRISICGHIHSGQHGGVEIKDSNGQPVCKSYNVSRVDEGYFVAYEIEKIVLD